MSNAEELQKIEALYAHGTLTREEFEQAKAKVLAADAMPRQPEQDSQTTRQMTELQQQNAVAELDCEWEAQKPKYMVLGGYSRYLPSKGGSIFGGLVIGAFGVFWAIMTHPMSSGAAPAGAPGFDTIYPFLGIILILVGLGSSINSYVKAGRYQQAEQQYQEKRARLLAGPV